MVIQKFSTIEGFSAIMTSAIEGLYCSGLSESSEINLHNQKKCTRCDENLVCAYKCQECDILCQKCYKAHSRLKITKIHVVTPL